MNKTLLTIALLASSVAAQAGVLGTLPNKAGGTIQFTDGTSKRCEDLDKRTGDVWFYAVSVSGDGEAMRGCWTVRPEDDQVEIRWGSDNDYKVSIYPNSAITRKEYYYKVFPRKSASARDL